MPHLEIPSPARVLLADEDPLSRGFVAENLTADGYHVVVAADRSETRRCVCSRRARWI
jgi:DNA-binding response OmpR family regulator